MYTDNNHIEQHPTPVSNAMGSEPIQIKRVFTPKHADGLFWRDVPQALKDAGKTYRDGVEAATVHHFGKVSGEVFWGVEVEWAFVAGFLSATATEGGADV